MVQLVRLFVLYEDLKLETAALQLPPTPSLEEVSTHYRRIYFLRRAYATVWEMDNAINWLQLIREFKQRKKTLSKRNRSEWDAAVKCFAKAKKFIDRQRNAYGGHVNDDVARHILSKIDDMDDSVGAMEIRISSQKTTRMVFKFVELLVDSAHFIDRGERDHAEYLNESWDLLLDAMRHGARAVQTLAEIYLIPAFGWPDDKTSA